MSHSPSGLVRTGSREEGTVTLDRAIEAYLREAVKAFEEAERKDYGEPTRRGMR
jgi:hypothetical protein